MAAMDKLLGAIGVDPVAITASVRSLQDALAITAANTAAIVERLASIDARLVDVAAQNADDRAQTTLLVQQVRAMRAELAAHSVWLQQQHGGPK